MRFIFIVIGWLLPQVLLAQFNSFEPGSYVLNTKPTIRHQGTLKLRSSDLLVVKDATGNKLKLSPRDVVSFRLGQQQYVTAVNFEVNQGLIPLYVEQAFVEQLDSGQVVLLRYEYSTGGGGAPMMGAGGAMTFGGAGGGTRTIYLLRRGSSISPVPSNSLSGAGPKFRAALLLLLGTRPDLVKLVEEKRVSVDDVPALVRALNTGKAFRALDISATPGSIN